MIITAIALIKIIFFIFLIVCAIILIFEFVSYI